MEVAAHQANLVREAANGPDVWVKVGKLLVRRHLTPRVNMFEPVEDDVCKLPASTLSSDRVTIVLGHGNKKNVVPDRWTEGVPTRPILPDSRKWCGVTLFGLLQLPEHQPPVAAAFCEAANSTTAHQKYWLPDPKAEAEMHRLEAVADNLENDGLVNVPVDPREVECAPEPEKSKWIDGIQNEMPNLDNMDVFDRATQEEYDTWKAHDSKLPRPLPAKLV